MLFTIVFILTFMIASLNLIQYVGVIFNNSINLPFSNTWFNFGLAWWQYPAFLYQIYFWFTYLNVIDKF